MTRYPTSVVRIVSVLIVAMTVPVLTSVTVNATAMFANSAKVTLTVTGIENLTTAGGSTDDLEILAGAAGDPFGFPPFPSVLSEGSASGTATSVLSPELVPPGFDPTVLEIGDSLSIELSTSGTASAVGYVDALVEAFGLVTIDNYSSTDDFEISLVLDIILDATASLDDPLTEDAYGGADVYALSYGGDIDVIAEIEADALFGIFDPPFASSTPYAITVLAGEFDDIEFYADAGGIAEAVPEPAAISVLLGGLALIRLRRLRNQIRINRS